MSAATITTVTPTIINNTMTASATNSIIAEREALAAEWHLFAALEGVLQALSHLPDWRLFDRPDDITKRLVVWSDYFARRGEDWYAKHESAAQRRPTNVESVAASTCYVNDVFPSAMIRSERTKCTAALDGRNNNNSNYCGRPYYRRGGGGRRRRRKRNKANGTTDDKATETVDTADTGVAVTTVAAAAANDGNVADIDEEDDNRFLDNAIMDIELLNFESDRSPSVSAENIDDITAKATTTSTLFSVNTLGARDASDWNEML